jgi:Na+-driven multidrug efflux pump
MIDKIDVKSFTRFIMPSVLLMIFVSVYTTVDGIFIARFVGPEALAGLNLSFPIYSIAFAVGIMFSTGGSAVIAIRIGRGEREKAAGNFTFLTLAGVIFGAVASIICLIFRERLIAATGASDLVRPHALAYSSFLIISFPFLIAKILFESLLRVDGKPRLALDMTLIGGVINLILDYVFMGPMKMGIAGAGLGTLLGIIFSLIPGLLRFNSPESILRFRWEGMDLPFLKSTVINGSSEMVNEAALAITTIVLNTLAIRYMGDQGLAAVAVLMALQFLGVSFMLGYAYGVSPLVSYNYGRNNSMNQQKIMLYSTRVLTAAGLVFFGLIQIAAGPLAEIYLPRGSEGFDLALRGLRFTAFGFLITGVNIYASALFTAFENGKISALLSFSKSFVIFMLMALILPPLLGNDGIWLIYPLTEAAALVISLFFLLRFQKRYSYSLSEIRIISRKRRSAA